jgi:peptidoglycan/xylan/chitin deacetylase (PgdA/CDA1 family)
VTVPILVYHHINFSPSNGRYYVSPAEFERQMYLLHEWGYKTISVELLATAIKNGALLPPRPILLTFDDGTLSTFNNAFPIMQKYNFTGTTYIIYNYIGAENYMNADELHKLVAAGWEIGSHSLSHENLTLYPKHQNNEIIESRRRLQSLLDVPILSFAYPFGAYDKDSLQFVRDAGYTAAMGLGNTARQNNQNIFYLYRRAIERDTNLQSFAQMLPWREASPDPALVTVLP